MAMLELLGSLVSGVLSPLFTFLNKTEDVKLGEFKIDGKVDVALVQASVAIAQANAALLNNKWMIRLQVAFGLPLAVYYGKCILWDKVLGNLTHGKTDALTGDISTYSLWIVGFLFMHSAITSWSRKT